MKNMFKIVLLCLIFLGTSCSVNYDLIVTSDKKYIEKLVVTMPREAYYEDDKLAEKQIEDLIDDFKNLERGANLYKYNYQITKEWVYFTISQKHSSFFGYKNSLIYSKLFEQMELVEENTYKLTVKGYLVDNEEGLPLIWEKEMAIEIQFHNEVISSNANETNNFDNTYTWYLDENLVDNGINVELSDKIRYDVVARYYFMQNILTIGLVTTITLFAGFIYYRWHKQEQIRNQL